MQLLNPQDIGAHGAQAADPSTELFESMVSGLREHIFGKGNEDIVGLLKDGADISDTIGETTYTLVQSAVEQVKASGGELDLDILLGVATQVIDDLIDLAESVGIEVNRDDDPEAALYSAIQAYLMNSNPDEQERASAQQILQQMKDDGDVDEAAGYIAERGRQVGVDPFAQQAPTGDAAQQQGVAQ